MRKEICYDMDGTIANFYGVDNWLEYLLKEDTYPYENAAPLVEVEKFIKINRELQSEGYKIKIISWLSKNGSKNFCERIKSAKRKWLEKTFPNFSFDDIIIIKYGIDKSKYGHGILFDDEKQNRENWEKMSNRIAYDINDIIETLKKLR